MSGENPINQADAAASPALIREQRDRYGIAARKLEMPRHDGEAFVHVFPAQLHVERCEGRHLLPDGGEGENVELVGTAWVITLIWELRQALLFPSDQGNVGIRLHRDSAPLLFAGVLTHTPIEVFEASYRLSGPEAIGPLLDEILLVVAPQVRRVAQRGARRLVGDFAKP